MRARQATRQQERHTDHTVHVGLGPDDVMIVVDDHWSAEDVEVLHNVFLDVSQRGDVGVVTCRRRRRTHPIYCACTDRNKGTFFF